MKQYNIVNQKIYYILIYPDTIKSKRKMRIFNKMVINGQSK